MSDPGSGAQRTVIVTGGASGIGLATVNALLADPATHCAIVDRSVGEAESAIEQWGADRVEFFSCDVTSHANAQEQCEAIEAWGPPIRGLVTSAGNQIKAPTLNVTSEQWHGVLDVHLDGSLFWCQVAGQRMVEGSGGSIVLLASVAMDFGLPGRAAYSCAKAAIGSLTRTLAVEWAPHNIRVNAVAPGWIMTDLAREAFIRDGYDADAAQAECAMGRFGEPHEVAEVIDFLLSPRASFVTGDIMNIDGGYAALKGS